jgi:hypothetical protein
LRAFLINPDMGGTPAKTDQSSVHAAGLANAAIDSPTPVVSAIGSLFWDKA